MQARWIALALAAGIMAAGPAQAGSGHDDDHGHDDRVEHYEGKKIESREQAVEALRSVNAKLDELLAGELTPQTMNTVHKISYTMENALPYLHSNTDSAAKSLEKMHLASERMEAEAVKTNGEAYLKDLRTILGEP
ncbi:hypothetical protein SAMN05216241_10334 [Limimonas halophila]|uniref:Uncharacterized protein n=1 Tax=Limimonas halophila TaxID=1082479 RepID=A0A1G7PR59_9PROT|nr:DUF6746 family protein [Limimonas halophila]SDF88728.1 hypothetical protein SAMN05216241_10334 [Limimonas halophila]